MPEYYPHVPAFDPPAAFTEVEQSVKASQFRERYLDTKLSELHELAGTMIREGHDQYAVLERLADSADVFADYIGPCDGASRKHFTAKAEEIRAIVEILRPKEVPLD